MAELAKLFRNGGSQAVRLPREHRFPGDQVRITKVPGGVLLQPVYADADAWFAAIDAAARLVEAGWPGHTASTAASARAALRGPR